MNIKEFDEHLKMHETYLKPALICIRPEHFPEQLFHYTDANGLLGMLGSTRIWATNFRYLNDSSEIRYGAALYESVLNEFQAKTNSPIVQNFLAITRNTFNAFEGMFDCYLACFCEKDNLLNQWRTYAESGGGYAVGFVTNEIGRRNDIANPNQEIYLRKVVYNEQLQRSLIGQILSTAIRALEESGKKAEDEDASAFIAKCSRFIRVQLSEYLVSFKHPAYEIEQEWRLCHIVEPRLVEHLKFRNGAFGLTPYVELDPTPADGHLHDKLPITRVSYGPVTDPENARHALDLLLHSKGYEHAEINGSDLPVRVGR